MINISLFCERLFKERTAAKMTLDDLGEKISTTRQTISRWERGKSEPSVNDLIKLCNIFNCDFGYLVGEYDCRTRQSTDIKTETGLSEKAIGRLRMMHTLDDNDSIKIISALISNPYFTTALEQAAIFLSITNDCDDRDTQLNSVKGLFSDDDYYTIRAIADEMIKTKAGIQTRELQASEIATLFKLSAVDSIQSAFKDVLQELSKNAT